MSIARRQSSAIRRKKNPSDRKVLYAAAAASTLLGTIAYFTTHSAGPVIAGVAIGMVATPFLFGADIKQFKQIMF